MSKIGRNLQKIIIVDNTKENFEWQKENGIEIKSYDNKKMDFIENNVDNTFIDNDNCLLELKKILVKIAEEKPKNLTLILKKFQRKFTKK